MDERPAARRLLFLIADTGGGHRASATAVAHQLESAHPGWYTVRILDPFAEAAPRLLGRTASLYGPLTQHASWLWGALYHATNSRGAVRALQGSLLRVVERGGGRVHRDGSGRWFGRLTGAEVGKCCRR